MSDILLVEDDPHQRILIQEQLEEEGYTTEVAPSGPAALECVQEHMPDLVVLDIAMPGMDGVELLGRLLAANNRLPVVIHTAFNHYKDNFMTWAADAYVVKHSNCEELKQAIRQVLARQQRPLPSAAPGQA